MLAAENGALPGGKVGGMGDVLRDLPRALVDRGFRVTVLCPAYGFLARLPDARPLGGLSVVFGGSLETCRRLEVPSGVEGLSFELLDHERFAPRGQERVYHDDPDGAPFATDASKFAFFSAAAATLIAGLDTKPDVVHLHDWHTGCYCLLREFGPRFRVLKGLRTVLSIHNLALQGTRPLGGQQSSFEHWFPELVPAPEAALDPRYADCVNPLAAGIRLADAVSTVSPTYAREILVPPDPPTGRRGGEGLEALLAAREREGVLTGILNGCEYPGTAPRAGWKRLVALMRAELDAWIAGGDFVDSAAWLAAKRVAELPRQKPKLLATSVGRVTAQKLGLYRERVGGETTAMERVLAALDGGLLIMLGSGDADYERFLQQTMLRCPNLLFLKGYSDRLADALYATGELYLMPSVFEPCGISQMLAMRAGQPCVVHAVGGLKDTVTAATGFPFGGDTPARQAQNFVRAVEAARDLKLGSKGKWQALISRARRARFTWDASASRYLHEVYGFDDDSAE